MQNKEWCIYSNTCNFLILNTVLHSIHISKKYLFKVVIILQTLFIQKSGNKAIVERAISNLLENYIHFISCHNRLVRIFQIFHLHSFTERKNHIQIPREAKRLNNPCNSFWINMKLASF